METYSVTLNDTQIVLSVPYDYYLFYCFATSNLEIKTNKYNHPTDLLLLRASETEVCVNPAKKLATLTKTVFSHQDSGI